MSAGGLTVVVNPRAGGGAFGPARVEALRRVIGPTGRLVLSISEEEVDSLCADIVSRAPGRVGILGGDGTAASIITGLWRASTDAGCPLPQVALLRGGTMNTIANALGIARGAPERLLSLLSSGHTTMHACDTLRVDGRLGFLLSTGVMYGFLAEYYGRGRTGAVAAAQLLTRGIGSILLGGPTAERMMQSYEATLHFDDRTQPPRRYVLVGAGTVTEVGLGFRLFSRANERPKTMHVVGFHGSERGLPLALPALSRGHCAGRRDTVQEVCERMVIATGGGPLGYSLDGDLYQCSGDLTVEMGPRLSMALARD